MSSHISPATTLDTLKQEAKRWHRGLVAGEREAWERTMSIVGRATGADRTRASRSSDPFTQTRSGPSRQPHLEGRI